MARSAVVKVAMPEPSSATVASAVEPSVKVTVPVGVPAITGETVATNVTGCP